MTEPVDILLATLNGARFLREQLKSIEEQTYPAWQLIVRDDGSTDGSLAILDEFAQRHAGRVRVLHDDDGRLGGLANFAAVLRASDAPYFLFCDQDDVWLPEKVTVLLKVIREAERSQGISTPILVHSDLIVVDTSLRMLHPSFWRYARLFAPLGQGRPERLILRNFITGCAALGNAALRRAALPIPRDAIVHDWWLGVVAAFLGTIVASETPTVLYRQHHANQLGAQSRDLSGIVRQLFRAPGGEIRRARSLLEKAQRQAAALQAAYTTLLSPQSNQMLGEFAHLKDAGLWRRKSFLFRHDVRPDYWVPSAVCWALL